MDNTENVQRYSNGAIKRAKVFFIVAIFYIPLSFVYLISSFFIEMSSMQETIFEYTTRLFFFFLIVWSLYNCKEYLKYSNASEKHQKNYDEETLEMLKEHNLLFDHKASRKNVIRLTILSVSLNVAFLVLNFFI